MEDLMSKLSTIHAAYIEEMRAILKSSELLLQKEKNALSGELKTSGKFCEDFIKSLITTHTPNHLRVTSGYILDSEKKDNDTNLSQFDLLLVDDSVPPIFRFKNADIEVVPVESVCGIFEIKRYINKNNIKDFIEKLSKSVLDYDGLTKSAPYSGNTINTANMSTSIRSPLIGIISLTSDLNINNTSLNDTPNVIDIIWSIDGFAAIPHRHITTSGQKQTNLADILSRPKNDSFTNISSNEWKNYINDGNEYEFFHQIFIDKNNPENILSPTIGWLTYILYRLCGRQGINPADMVNKYYFNRP
jgi:hypothetical protein